MLVALSLSVALAAPAAPVTAADLPNGYYRSPAIHGDSVVFVAEGDLWRVPVAGGSATRLTSHHGDEDGPAISPDGDYVAFTGQYDGPTEVYVMPLQGGLPKRVTWEGRNKTLVAGWTPDGRVLYATDGEATYPTRALFTVDPKTLERAAVPLWQAAAGTYDDTGKTLFFAREGFQGSHTKRYQGGTVQQIWRWDGGTAEAKPITGDWAGTSASPMWWKGRVYFVSDRDASQNLWSMDVNGGDLKQITHESTFDVASPSMDAGRIVYQLGADLHLVDVTSGQDRTLNVRLDSDFDQLRPEVVDKPIDWLSAVHLSPSGDAVVLTARGRVFVAPSKQGRFVDVTHDDGTRYRAARYLGDGKSLVALSDASGEVELVKLPANGVGSPVPLTTDGDVLRWEAVPSPDGKHIAHDDKDQRLWITDVDSKKTTKIAESLVDRFSDLTWSADGRWLAFVQIGDNQIARVRLWDTATSTLLDATSDRFDSGSPAFSHDGKWLYFLTDRHLQSWVGSPWGADAPEPYMTDRTEVFALALQPGLRSPFTPDDELHPADAKKEADKTDKATDAKKGDKKADDKKTDDDKKGDDDKKKPPRVEIDAVALMLRLYHVPVPPGNYSQLTATDAGLFWLAKGNGPDAKTAVEAVPIRNHDVDVVRLAEDVEGYELSADGKKLLVHKKDGLYVVDTPNVATAEKPVDLDKSKVDLSGWHLVVVPQLEWRQMFVESWRLERDYFYDTHMHGVDWKHNLATYLPLVDRVRSRAELSDLIGQMVGELSALHTFVRGGDLRRTDDHQVLASLGATVARDTNGWRVVHITASDPDDPDKTSPLQRPETAVVEGDTIVAVDGRDVLSVPDLEDLLADRGGQQVLLRIRSAAGKDRDTIVVPITSDAAADLRYGEWELTRREKVEAAGNHQIAYVHLRAMGTADWSAFAKGFYPDFDKQGLIIDVRDNRGGNIDSWILSRLLRKSWFYWTQRVGHAPSWNMQEAFRGHVAVICDGETSSDGEAFSEGIKRLGIGRVFGTRTWGGEIWLSSDNFLVDNGIATAAEFGVYGPEGTWLVEGHGVDPDEVVDTPPHAGFAGQDPPLDAAVAWLKQQIADHPVVEPPQPPFPNKAYKPPPR